jgi:alkylation response protein AidB-like acyl-CoA dehydrogenase
MHDLGTEVAVTLGVTEDHRSLHDTARRWVEARNPLIAARETLDAPTDELPPFWDELAAMGWLGLHVPEEHGGSGFGLAELAVVLEELGRAVAPGPILPTVLAAAVIHRMADDDEALDLLPGLADGSTPGAVAFASDPDDREWSAVLGAATAKVVVVPRRDGWWALPADAVTVVEHKSLDPTRRLATVRLDGDPAGAQLGPEDRPGLVRDLAATLLAAESAGGSAWCVDTAAAYAKDREQFGRPIGQFQAVKHRCADMLGALELTRAVAWDAARGGAVAEVALAAAVAGAMAPEAYAECAQGCVQVHGGIGFTWEHDAHLFLRRAMATRQLLGGAEQWHDLVVERARAGARRSMTVDLPAEADAPRAEVEAFLEDLQDRDRDEWDARIADGGWLVPNWPAPWGRDAGPIEQLVIDEAFREAHIRRRHLQVGAWVLPTLIVHGTPEQQERFIGPTLAGEVLWCQMFSEPGAGSDLASLTTKAEKVDGGWAITGQKVWTTMAHIADWGICLARTNPSAAKHLGISCFLVDLTTPGIEVRPLRELTGAEMFNEVFLDDVFVPDDLVVGEVDTGWEAARTTLANERVSMGSGGSFGPGVEGLLAQAGPEASPVVVDRVGRLLAESHAIAALGWRSTLRALTGADPGPEASVRKLIGVEHEQRIQELGLGLLGPAGAIDEGDGAAWIGGYLGNRCLSIAGGTSEIQRNVIAERLLGLPKDP